jgi:hypothetical protein
MKALSLVVLIALASGAALAEPKKATFEGVSPEFKWTLRELNPDLPSDWSSYQFLTLELRSSTAQRFEFRVFTADGTRRIRLHPFQGAWIRAALPLAYFQRPDRQGFDLASLGNKSRAAYWINLMGGYGPVNTAEAIGVAMQDPNGAPRLKSDRCASTRNRPATRCSNPSPSWMNSARGFTLTGWARRGRWAI